MERRPGPPSEIENPQELYAVITAIDAIAGGKPSPFEDMPLQWLVQSIASDEAVRDRKKRVSAICRALAQHRHSPERRNPWHGKKTETIRSYYRREKQFAKRLAKKVKALE